MDLGSPIGGPAPSRLLVPAWWQHIEDAHRKGRRGGGRPRGGRPITVGEIRVQDLHVYEQNGGHTIRRHCNPDPAADVSRLQHERDIEAAGSFGAPGMDRESRVRIAQAAIEQCVRYHSDDMRRWLLRGAQGTYVAELYFTDAIGAVLTREAFRRGETQPAPATGVRIVLRHSPRLDGGFFVLTAYPLLRPAHAVPTERLVTYVPDDPTVQRIWGSRPPSLGEQLRQSPETGYASRFFSPEAVRATVGAAIREWSGDISRWLNGGGGTYYSNVSRFRGPIGELLTRDAAAQGRPPVPADRLRFELLRDPSSEDGFQVGSAHPWLPDDEIRMISRMLRP